MKIQELFERPRAKIILISVAVFLLITGTVVAIACIGADRDKGEDIGGGGEYIGAFAEQTTKPVNNTTKPPANGEQALVFESNGDGTCALVGVSDKNIESAVIPEESPAGDVVTEIDHMAFYGCASLRSIEIPKSVKAIGNKAFSGCTSLEYFIVDSANTKYSASGGVLYSKDKSTLIAYPTSRVGKSFLIASTVNTIGAYAFEDPIYLQKILYGASASRFAEIEIEAGNEALSQLSFTYNYSGAK